MKTLTDKILALGRQHEALRAAEEKQRTLRAAFVKSCGTGFWSSSSRSDKHLCITLALPVYLESYPDEKPTLRSWVSTTDGKTYGCMEYPKHFVGWLRPDFALWIEASTPTVVIKEAAEDFKAPAELAA